MVPALLLVTLVALPPQDGGDETQPGRRADPWDRARQVAALVAAQGEDGSFADSATATAAERVEATAFAMLALCEHGSSMRHGPHRDHLKRAVQFLSPGAAEPIGHVTPDGAPAAYAAATLALAHVAHTSSYRLLIARARPAADLLPVPRAERPAAADVPARVLARATLAWSEVRAIGTEPDRADVRAAAAEQLLGATDGTQEPSQLALAAAAWCRPDDAAVWRRWVDGLAVQLPGLVDLEALWIGGLARADTAIDDADRFRFELLLRNVLRARAAEPELGVRDRALLILAASAAGLRAPRAP